MPDVFWAAFGGGAAGGLFVIIAVIIAEWLRWFLDRPLVHVKATSILRLDPISRDVENMIGIEAINPHTKPVTLSSFGFAFKDRKSKWLAVSDPRLPYVLSGGQKFLRTDTPEELVRPLKKDGKHPRDLKWVLFWSQSGKLFRSKIHKSIIQEFEKAYLDKHSET